MVQPEPRKKALVIAVSEFDDDSLDDLPFCKKGGEQMIKVLEKRGFEIKKKEGLVGKVSGIDMRDAINEFFEDSTIKHTDTMLFYFTGHGLPRGGQHYFSSSDIDPRIPGRRGLLFSELSSLIDRCTAKCVVAMLDCCYAGAAGIVMGDATSQLENIKNNQQAGFVSQGEGRCLLAACDDNEQANPHSKQDYGFFTYYLLEGMNGAEGASVNEKGELTPQSIMSYVNSAIDTLPQKERPLQRPFIKNIGRDEIKLAYFEEWNRLKPQPTIEEQLISLLKEGKLTEFNTLKKQNPDIILHLENFSFPENANLKGINLNRAYAIGINLSRRDMTGAMLTNAIMKNAILDPVVLRNAVLDGCDLEGATMKGTDLTGASLRGTILRNANLEKSIFIESKDLKTAYLEGANFCNSKLNNLDLGEINFSEAKLEGADLSNAVLVIAIMRKANLQNAKLANAALLKTNLNESNLENADLTGAKLHGTSARLCNFKNSKLTGASCIDADLRYSNFENADFRGAVAFSDVMLEESNLTGANLAGLHLVGANLKNANLEGANLKKVIFEDAILDGTILRNADLSEADLSSSILRDVDLSGAKLSGAKLPTKKHNRVKRSLPRRHFLR